MSLTPAARNYVGAVIASGALLTLLSLAKAEIPDLNRFLIYLVFTMAAAPVKLRLPRMDGAFSLGFLPLLVGVAHFSMPETVLAACAGALTTSVVNRRTSPTVIQALFNTADLVLSVAGSYGAVYWLSSSSAALLPVRLAAAAAVYFFLSTILVSGILSLLNGKSLSEVNGQWYSWMFPYYILGAVFVGILSIGSESSNTPAWLAALPLFHLIHFFYGLTQSTPAGKTPSPEVASLPVPARIYVSAVVIGGLVLALAAAWNWQVIEWPRLAGYLAVTLFTAALKVRLPFLTGTLSFGFVPILVAALQFSFPETIVLAAATAAVQALWKPANRPQPIQVLFNIACMILAAAAVVLLASAPWQPGFSVSKLVAATVTLYLANTLMVAQVLSLLQNQSLFSIWRQCYFWTLPFYSVGCLIVALMVITAQSAGWQLSLFVLPLAAMIYFSYRMHVGAASRAVDPAVPA